jgi:hypothetical protein
MKVKVIEKAMPNSEFSLLPNNELRKIAGGLTQTTSCSPYTVTAPCEYFHTCGTDPNGYSAGPAYVDDTRLCTEYFTWTTPCPIAGKCPLLG